MSTSESRIPTRGSMTKRLRKVLERRLLDGAMKWSLSEIMRSVLQLISTALTLWKLLRPR